MPPEEFERRSREEFEGDHGGRGVAGEPEHKFPLCAAEHERLSGLNQHAVEIEFGAEIRKHAFHDVVFAGRDATR